jgi:hypothetical protein
MRTHNILFIALLSVLCLSCSPILCLQKRTNRLIEKSHKNADTIYLYSAAFNDFNLVWYHKANFIYSFGVKPNRTEKYKPIEANNITINNDSLMKYFDTSLYKDIECFDHTLDGEWIELYITGKREVMRSSIDMQCLFNKKFMQNTFPYKLQYDFSKIRKSKDFDFKKLYPEPQ